MREAIRAAIEALEKAEDFAGDVHQGEWAGPGDRRDKVIDKIESALSLLREAVGGGEDADLAVKFRAQHDFLEWNRQQAEPLVKIAYEYGVFDKAVELYKAAMKEGK